MGSVVGARLHGSCGCNCPGRCTHAANAPPPYAAVPYLRSVSRLADSPRTSCRGHLTRIERRNTGSELHLPREKPRPMPLVEEALLQRATARRPGVPGPGWLRTSGRGLRGSWTGFVSRRDEA